MSKIVFLEVPYHETHQAKLLGAKWNPAAQKWYVPEERDPKPFSLWLPEVMDDFRLSKEDRRSAVAVAFMSAVVLLAVVVARIPRSDFGHWAEGLKNIGQFVLSLLGSSAAVWWWMHKGSASPRLKVTQSVSILPPAGDYIPLYVTAHLDNVGEVPIILSKWCLWATDMLPLPPAVDTLLNTEPDRACRDYKLPWGAAAGAEFEIPVKDAPRVRPGESQDIGALLRVPADAQFIRIYSFLPHESLSGEAGNRGWTSISLINLAKEAKNGG